MRALILIATALVIALVSAVMLVPRGEATHVTTEEIRTSHGHHHKSVASWTDDTDGDDDDDDGDDDVLASTTPIAIAPTTTLRPHAEIVFVDDDALGPASAHAQLLERPPRA